MLKNLVERVKLKSSEVKALLRVNAGMLILIKTRTLVIILRSQLNMIVISK